MEAILPNAPSSFKMTIVKQIASYPDSMEVTFRDSTDANNPKSLVYTCQYDPKGASPREQLCTIQSGGEQSGTFILTSAKGIVGETAYNFNVIEYTITVIFVVYPVSFQTSPQTFNDISSLTARIKLSPEYTTDTCPRLYCGRDETYQLQNCVIDQENIATFNIPSNINNGNYNIYYKISESKFVDTSIEIIVEIPSLVVSFTFLDGTLCDVSMFHMIKLTLERGIDRITRIAIANSAETDTVECVNIQYNEDHKTVMCAISCDVGTYKLKSVECSAQYSVDNLDELTVKETENNPIVQNNQLDNPIHISSHIQSFEIELVDASTVVPKFYIDEDKELTCTKVADDSAFVKCNVDQTIINTTTENIYKVYYHNTDCDKPVSSGIQLFTIQPSTITVNSVSLGDGSTCSTNPFTTIKIETATSAEKVLSATITGTGGTIITYSKCEVNALEITCTEPNNEFISDNYVLTSITGLHNYDVSGVNNVNLVYSVVLAPYSQQVNKTVVDASNTNSFDIIMASDSIPSINFYIKGEPNLLLSCSGTTATRSCSVNETVVDFSTTKTYEILYEDPNCGTVQSTGLTIRTINSISVTIKEFYQGDGKICYISSEEGMFTSVQLVADVPPGEDTVNQVLILDYMDVPYTFSSCTVNGVIIICTNPNTVIPVQTYKLGSVSGDNSYTIPQDLPSIKYVVAIDPIAPKEQQILVQQVSESFKKVYIQLIPNAPTAFFAVGDTAFTAVNMGNEYYWLNLNQYIDYTTEKEYDLLYTTSSCNSKYTRTGITIKTVTTAPEVNILSFTIEDGKKCSTTPFKTLKVTGDTPFGYSKSIEVEDKRGSTYVLECEKSEDSLTLTCTYKNDFGTSTYTLSSINVVNKCNYSQLSVKMENEKEYIGELKNENVDFSYQQVSPDSTDFVIPLLSSDRPNFFLGAEESKQIDCSKYSNKLVKCTVNSTFVDMTQSTGYEIYYKDVCNNLVSTGITLNSIPSVDEVITITSITLRDGSKCMSNYYYDVLENLIIHTDKHALNVTGATITPENGESIEYFLCESIENTIVCFFPQDVKFGKFSLTSITGINTFTGYDVNTFEYKELEDLVPYENQETTQYINMHYNVFNVELASSDMALPEFYINNIELSCSLLKGTTVQCVLDSSAFDLSENFYRYDVDYKGTCDGIYNTNIQLYYKTPSDRTINTVTFNSDSKCSIYGETDIYITANDKFEKIKEIVIQNEEGTRIKCNDITFISNTNLSCKFAELPVGIYTLTGVVGINNFDISPVSAEQLKIVAQPSPIIAEVQPEKQTVKKGQLSFIINVNADVQIPSFYVEDNKAAQLDCSQDGQVVTCNTNFTIMPNTQDYYIYYQGVCGELVSTEIAVHCEPPKIVKVNSISVNGNSFSTTAITSLSINLNEVQDMSISTVTVKSGDQTIVLDNCSPNGSKIECSFEEGTIPEGEISLVSIEGENDFNTESMSSNSIEYQIERVSSAQSEPYPVLNGDNPSFYVDIVDPTLTLPTIYVGTNTSNIIPCELEEEKLKCTPTQENFPSTGRYDIYYQAALQTTPQFLKIQVDYTAILTINVQDVTLDDTSACSTQSISSIQLTLDQAPTSSIKKATLSGNGKEIVFDTCTHVEQVITCEGNTINDEGEYILTNVIGGDNYVLSAVTGTKIKIDHSSQPIDATKQITPQNTHKQQKTFTIELEDANTVPEIYVDNEDNQLTCDVSGTTMTCSVDNNMFSETKEYSIFFKGVCDKLSKAVTVNHVVPKSIYIKKFTFPNGEKCTDQPITAIKFSFEEDPLHASNAKISDGSVYNFLKCETDGLDIICSEPAQTLPGGAYTIMILEGIEHYLISIDILKIELIYDPIYIDTTTEKTYTINYYTPSFRVPLQFTTKTPELFVENDATKKIPCEIKDNALECTPNDSLMPTSNNYSLYYYPPCKKQLESVNIIIDYSVTIKPTKVSLTKSSSCTKDEIVSIIITTDRAPTASVSKAVLEDETGGQYTFSTCSYKDTSITCSDISPTITKKGDYTLVSIEGIDTFVLSEMEDTNSKITFEPDVLSNEQKTEQIINNDTPSFEIKLAASDVVVPNVYIGKSNQVECEAENDLLICTPDKTNLPSNGEYDIYYDGSCSTLTKSSIKVIRDIVVKATNFTLEDESMCNVETFTSIIVTLEKEQNIELTEATISNGNEEFTFTTCTRDEETNTIITCTTPNESVIFGKYKLTSLKGPDRYDLSLLEDVIVRYEDDPLAEQTLTAQVYDNDTKTFTLELSTDTVDQPVVFITKDDEKMEFNCTKEGTTLTCEYNDTLMPQNGEFEIQYEAACQHPFSTNITVTRLLPLTVSNIMLGTSLEEQKVCSGEGISTITITLDNIPFTDVNSMIITDESTDYTIENCTTNGTSVTCDTPVSQIDYGVYKIKEIDGGEPYIIDNVTEIELKYEYDPVETLDENDIYIILDNETLSFTVQLKDNETEIPHIYVGNDVTAEIQCVQDENDKRNLVCSPDNSNMPENIVYEIYYEGPCGELKNTRIMIENTNAPVNRDPEIEIVTSGNNLMIGKVMLGILIMLML